MLVVKIFWRVPTKKSIQHPPQAGPLVPQEYRLLSGRSRGRRTVHKTATRATLLSWVHTKRQTGVNAETRGLLK